MSDEDDPGMAPAGAEDKWEETRRGGFHLKANHLTT